MFAGIEYAWILSDGLTPAISGDLAEGRIDVDNGAVGISNHDGFTSFFKHPCRQGQLCRCPFVFYPALIKFIGSEAKQKQNNGR